MGCRDGDTSSIHIAGGQSYSYNQSSFFITATKPKRIPVFVVVVLPGIMFCYMCLMSVRSNRGRINTVCRLGSLGSCPQSSSTLSKSIDVDLCFISQLFAYVIHSQVVLWAIPENEGGVGTAPGLVGKRPWRFSLGGIGHRVEQGVLFFLIDSISSSTPSAPRPGATDRPNRFRRPSPRGGGGGGQRQHTQFHRRRRRRQQLHCYSSRPATPPPTPTIWVMNEVVKNN